jgi:LysM repeat protein
MEKGLTIGQQVKIPLNEQNFDVSGAVAAGETLIPVTHIVLKSETITKIGADYKVTPKLVKQWNSLSTDNITPGAPLIVGHLKVKSGDLAFNTAKPAATVSNEAPVAKNADVNTAA